MTYEERIDILRKRIRIGFISVIAGLSIGALIVKYYKKRRL